MRTRRIIATIAACAVFASGYMAVTSSSAVAAPTASISGTVRQAGTGAPLFGILIMVLQLKKTTTFSGQTVTGPVLVASSNSAADGSYTVAGLGPDSGGYYVCFTYGIFTDIRGACFLNVEDFSPFPNPVGLTQVPFGASRVRVLSGQHVQRIDAALRVGAADQDYGSIAGTVTQRYIGSGLKGVRVTAYDSSGTVVDETMSGAGGKYVLDGVLPSTVGYRICFDGSGAVGGLTLKAYGSACYRSAVPVAAQTTTQHVDIALQSTA